MKFGKYDVFANMKWLEVEVEKKQQQQYMEHRLKLYQQRCVGHGCCGFCTATGQKNCL